MSIEIVNEDSFQCAQRLVSLKYKPIVLDFASGSNPAKGNLIFLYTLYKERAL
jgi:hypothetical protein